MTLRIHDAYWPNPPRRRVCVTQDFKEVWGADYQPDSSEHAGIKRITRNTPIGAGLHVTPAQFDELRAIFNVSLAAQERGVAENGGATPPPS